MVELPTESLLYFCFSAHCLIGIIAAIVAQHKHQNLNRWLLWGLLGGTAALIAAIRLDSKAP